VTFAIDSTVATLTGSQTLTNKSLTAPTLTGTAVVASLDISGDVDIDGTLETDALSINGTTVTSTAAELNILDGVTSTAAELNILDGVTSTTAELNILDGVTATAAELNIMDGVTATAAELNILDGVTVTAAEINTLDGITAVLGELNALDLGSTAIGTAVASKAVILDSNKDYTGIRNFTITGELDAATLDISGDIDVDGTTNLDVVDIDGAVDMASTLTVAGEVFIAEKLSHTGDTDTHFKFAGANDIRIVAGGVDHVAFDGTIVFNQSAADMDLRVESTGNQNMLFIDSGNDVVNIGGGTQQTGDVLSIHGSGTNTVARMYNTNAGADGNIFIFQKASETAADNDVLGDIRFHGNDDGGTMTQYAQIKGTSADVTNGTEDGQLVFNAILNGTNRERLKINATQAVFNEEGQDLDFRVESNGNANMLFVDAGNDHVNIGTASDLGGVLNVNGNVNVTGQGDFSTEVLVGSSNTGLSDNTLIFRTGGAAFIDHNTVGQGIRCRVSASSSLDTAAFDVSTGEMVINEEGADYDFRVESDGNANMLFVDAGNDRVGIGASTTNSVLHAATSGTGSIPTDHFIQTTDANTVFTAINTSDSATYSAIKLETRQTQASGFMIANEYQSAFNGDLVFRSRNAGSTSNENFRIKSSGSIIFTGKPATSPIFEMVNPDNEDVNTGRETSVRFSGHRSGGEDVVNSQISGNHVGSADDDKGGLFFYTNGGSGLGERMRITDNKIVINPDAIDQDFQIASDSNSNMLFVDAGSNFVGINKNNAVSTCDMSMNAGSTPGIQTQNLTTGTTNLVLDVRSNGTSTIGTINATNTATQFNTSSDYRLKENVETLKDGLDRLNQLKPVQFTWKVDDSFSEGFIAHEVDEVFSDAVTGEKDAVDDKGEIKPQQVDYGRITPLLVKAIQEQQEQIEELKAEIATLKGE